MTESQRRRALITGITGQDGSYLADLLLEKGYEIHGLIRRASSISNTHRIDHIFQDPHERDRRVVLHYGDMSDASALNRLISEIRPHEVYNLAGQSHVKVSFEAPEYTGDVVALGTLRLLDAIRHFDPSIRFYQASSSEMFGTAAPPQSESTKFYPRSPYGAAKVYAHHITINYREAYGMFAASGILFNHESIRRGETFVTRKISRAVAQIVSGRRDSVYLGNLDTSRDWGYAPDYVRAMWMMLQQDDAQEFVIATGESHTVREFCELAFQHAGLDWQKYVRIDPSYYRPTEVDFLQGNPTKAYEVLGWKPTISFAELVHHMVDGDLELEGIRHPNQAAL